MNLKDFIAKLIAEGKNAGEICAAVTAKKTEIDETKNASSTEIADLVFEQIENAETQKLFTEKQNAKKLEADKKVAAKKEDEKINSIVDAKLKSININPAGNQFDVAPVKRFNMTSGKLEDITEKMTPERIKFNDMLRMVGVKNTSSAAAISAEIDQQNAKDAKYAGKILRSDSDAVGGYAVPTLVKEEFAQLMYQESVMLQKANTDNIIVEDKIYPTMGDAAVVDITDQSTNLTETTPAVGNPTVTMKRTGAFSYIANTLISQRVDIVNATIIAYKSAFARYIDLRTMAGNVTGNSQPIDGLIFDSNTQYETVVAATAFSIANMVAMQESIDDEANEDSMYWIGNRKVMNLIGQLENSGGQSLFPTFFTGGTFEPLGIQMLKNTKIPSTLDVGGDNATTGTDDALTLADLSKIVLGVDTDNLRIETSDQYNFKADALTIRGILRLGWASMFSNTVRVLEITN